MLPREVDVREVVLAQCLLPSFAVEEDEGREVRQLDPRMEDEGRLHPAVRDEGRSGELRKASALVYGPSSTPTSTA